MPDTQINNHRTVRLYTIGEAARLAGVSAPTVNRWIHGSQDQAPVLDFDKTRPHDAMAVSFLELLEIVVAQKFRKRNVTIDRIRQAHAYARQELSVPYPFAWLRLETLGGRILRDFEEANPGAHLVEVNPGQQAALPGLVKTTLQAFDFANDQFAERWHPFGRENPIVIDPTVSAGAPTVIDRRITVETVYKRWKAGWQWDRIADELELTLANVEAVLRYADKVRMAA